MLSLFMAIAGGVSWEEVIRPLQEKLGRQKKLLEGPGGPSKKDAVDGRNPAPVDK